MIRDLIAATKALSDENRLRILAAMQDREVCACQIIELLNLAGSTVSKHLAILKQARLIDARKEGRWMHYRLAGPETPRMVHDAIQWAMGALSKEKQIVEDSKRLKAILHMDPEELCCRQREAKRRGPPLQAVERPARFHEPKLAPRKRGKGG